MVNTRHYHLMNDYYRQNHKYTFLVCDEDLYLYKTARPYDEGFIKKVKPTNIISSIKYPPQEPLDPIFQSLPKDLITTILFKVALFKFQCRRFKEVHKILLLKPELFTKFYIKFFPKETNQIYALYFNSFQRIYQDRISRTLFFCMKLHQQLIRPQHESPPYYILEIHLADNPIFIPVLPWTIITGKRPINYTLRINTMSNEYPNDNENHFAFVTGPVIGDIAWLRGTFYTENILLASTFQRPVLPIIFTGKYHVLYRGSTILESEHTWYHFTKMLQFIYGEGKFATLTYRHSTLPRKSKYSIRLYIPR